ncbi:cytochrome c [Mangrovimonas sp. YM274]|uniref:c-type cytochrome n=1 Tax=Mangrovimonas sp. YM274 TaxID=3070660 RepID=UPI0027DBD14E|nr:cytochrome c [Mangrovimonas sp. YM274]WMI67783.1 cytochrome c [Mangrovimonas sp. YM274]
MALFLSLGANEYTSVQNASHQESIKKGKVVYENFCMTCHMANGEGIPRAFPPLAKADYLMNNRKESIKAIKYGLSGTIVVNGDTFKGSMAPLGLSDKEVADVMNYITNSWGNKNDKMVTEKEVSEIRP